MHVAKDGWMQEDKISDMCTTFSVSLFPKLRLLPLREQVLQTQALILTSRGYRYFWRLW
jgi:hypothetical protein